MVFVATCIIFWKEFRSLLYPTFTIKERIRKPTETIFPSHQGGEEIKERSLHLIHFLEQIVIDLLAHDRIKLISRMRPDKVPDPRRWGLEFPGGPFADEVEVFEETASFVVVDIQGIDVFVDEGY